MKLIFSTYQSASVVGAAMPRGEAFDFAVFDEAHKTAGREGRNFAFALDDKNLAIRKRLFLTAAPRHYKPVRGGGRWKTVARVQFIRIICLNYLASFVENTNRCKKSITI